MIFETERLRIRYLTLKDLNSFHKMQSNPKVMQFADGEVDTFEGHRKELITLINKYEIENNDFWIYAIERKIDEKFLGTLALVKDGDDDEIGYRFLEEFWNKGYGKEVCKATLEYCKHKGMQQLVAYCIDANVASAKILKGLNFDSVDKLTFDNQQFSETKYKIQL